MHRPWLWPVIGLLLAGALLPPGFRASGPESATVRRMEPGRVTDGPKTRFYLRAPGRR